MSFYQHIREIVVLLCAALGEILTSLNLWLRGQLEHVGVPHTLHTMFLLAITLTLLAGALQNLTGLVRVLVVMFFVAAAYHFTIPPPWQS